MDTPSFHDFGSPLSTSGEFSLLFQDAMRNFEEIGEVAESPKATPDHSRFETSATPNAVPRSPGIIGSMLPPPITTALQSLDKSSPHGLTRRYRKPKSRTLRPKDWEPHKARAIELHINQDKPLEEVKDIIQKETGFEATARQYRTQISKWGLDKNIKLAEMRYITKKQVERQNFEPQKPALHFRVRGAVVEPANIERWQQRRAFDVRSITYEIHTRAGPSAPASSLVSVPASTPSGLSYSTASEGCSALESPASMAAPSAAPSPADSIDTVELIADSVFTGQSPRLFDTVVNTSAMNHIHVSGISPMKLLQPVGPHHLPIAISRHSQEVQLRWEISQAEQTHGADSEEVLNLLENLYWFYADQGRLKSEEETAKKMLKIARTTYGKSSRQSARFLGWLGATLSRQGRQSQAEKMLNEALGIANQEDGPDSLLSVNITSALAYLYLEIRRFQDVVPLCRHALKIRKSRGMCCVYDLVILGSVLGGMGQLAEAESLQLEAFQLLGRPTSTDLYRWYMKMGCIHYLADMYIDQNRFREAENYLHAGMQDAEPILGTEHPVMLGAMETLANSYKRQDRYYEAERLYLKVEQGRMRVFGENHSYTLRARALRASVRENEHRIYEGHDLGARLLLPHNGMQISL